MLLEAICCAFCNAVFPISMVCLLFIPSLNLELIADAYLGPRCCGEAADCRSSLAVVMFVCFSASLQLLVRGLLSFSSAGLSEGSVFVSLVECMAGLSLPLYMAEVRGATSSDSLGFVGNLEYLLLVDVVVCVLFSAVGAGVVCVVSCSGTADVASEEGACVDEGICASVVFKLDAVVVGNSCLGACIVGEDAKHMCISCTCFSFVGI